MTKNVLPFIFLYIVIVIVIDIHVSAREKLRGKRFDVFSPFIQKIMYRVFETLIVHMAFLSFL